MNKYIELRNKHEKEFNDFPKSFAFSRQQFKEGMENLGLTEKDIDKVFSIGHGGFIRKTDVEACVKMCENHKNEIWDAINNDKTGEAFIYDMFSFELANHEFIITGEVTDTLDALNITNEDLEKNKNLSHGLELACKNQYNLDNEDIKI